MFNLTTVMTIVTEIAKSFVVIGRTFLDMYIVIKARVVYQRTHKMNLAAFANDIDTEAPRKKWVLSYPSKFQAPVSPLGDLAADAGSTSSFPPLRSL
jgi:hypothetical protein